MNLTQLATTLAATLEGDGRMNVDGIATLLEAGSSELSFVSDKKHAAQAETTRAAALIVGKDFTGTSPAALLRVADVEAAVEKTLELFAPALDVPPVGIHPMACVAATADIGSRVAIGPGVVVGENVTIGEGTVLFPGCVIGREVVIGRDCRLFANVVVNARCRLGDRVMIHPNSTIGADGFGYRFVEGRHRKITHIGIVVIEDDVEIGANSCVDRAKFGQTVIGRGTKIDNLVQVAHNVKVGEHSILVAQVGVAGSAKLGKYVVLGGQVAVRDHVTIGDGAMIGATSGVERDVEAGAKLVGTPARPAREFFRRLSLIEKLPEMAEDIKQLKRDSEKRGSTENHS